MKRKTLIDTAIITLLAAYFFLPNIFVFFSGSEWFGIMDQAEIWFILCGFLGFVYPGLQLLISGRPISYMKGLSSVIKIITISEAIPFQFYVFYSGGPLKAFWEDPLAAYIMITVLQITLIVGIMLYIIGFCITYWSKNPEISG